MEAEAVPDYHLPVAVRELAFRRRRAGPSEKEPAPVPPQLRSKAFWLAVANCITSRLRFIWTSFASALAMQWRRNATTIAGRPTMVELNMIATQRQYQYQYTTHAISSASREYRYQYYSKIDAMFA